MGWVPFRSHITAQGPVSPRGRADAGAVRSTVRTPGTLPLRPGSYACRLGIPGSVPHL